jgi:hypothetical protein
MNFESIPLDQAYGRLDALPPQTYVEMGPGLSIKRKASGVPVMRIHYDAIPERNSGLHPEWKERERKKYTSRGWDKEQEIDDGAGGGERLFASLLSAFGDKIIIDDPKWFPNPEWDCCGGFDHGKTNATCLLKAYMDFDGNIYLCGEFYQMKTATWDNNIWQNIPILQQMPDLNRMRWLRADPSIFYDKEAQADGTFASLDSIYRKNGFRRLTTFPTSISREDLTFEERLNDHWANLSERKPTLFIVCRNESDKRQPGLHRYDCPNLLWELRRMRRKELTARQLLERNPTENIVDKNNHAWDSAKYLIMSLPKPTAVPLETQLKELVKDLNPMSAAIAAQRFVSLQGGPGAQRSKGWDLRSRRRMSR